MGHRQHIWIAVIAVGVLALVALGLRHYAPYAGRSAMPKQPPTVVLAMEDVYLVGLGHDGKLWSAKARKVEIGQDRATANLKDIRDARIFSGDKVALTARAGDAVYQTYRRDLTLGGGVEIVGSGGQKVTGQGATWNSATSLLRSIGQVSFESRWGKVAAEKLVADLKSQELGMWNVSMKIRLDALDGAAKEAR
ncbi:MAG: LPS export ABC transporter periplasmic protein LptC [Armatimonadota bacterium]